MKKKQSPEEILAAFIAANPQANKTAISEGTGLKGIVLVNTIKKMVKAGELTEEGTGKEAIYTVAETAAEQPAETSNELEIPVEDEQKAAKSKGRDNSTLSYAGEQFKKGPLVRRILTDHVAANKGITYKKLKESFPDELLKRFGVFQDEDTARQLSGARDRYAFQPSNTIKLKDKNIVICNQWTLDNIQPFLKAARALGYKIK